MKIANDKIEIEDSDVTSFSSELQKDIAFRAGPKTTPHEYLSARFNAVLEEASYIALNAGLDEIKDVCIAVVKADKSTQDQIKTLLKI